jgi:hypothetical protein
LLDTSGLESKISYDENSIYADIVYSSSSENVKEVMIDGKWIVKGGESLKYDEDDLKRRADEELRELLKRVE